MSADFVPLPSVLIERLSALGVDMPRVLRHAAIPTSRFQPARAKLSVPEFFAFWRALEAVGSGPDLGLRLGKEAMPSQLDVASLAALHSRTLDEGLQKISRYKRLICGEHVSIERADHEARLGFHWLHQHEAQPLMLVDATFMSVVSLASHGLGQQLLPLRVELARRRTNQQLLERYFGCKVSFDAPLDRLVLSESALARPLVTHNADLLAVLLPALDAELQGRSSRTLLDDVRTALSRCMSGEKPSVERIAEGLGMSPRTLQRRLGELGATYQELLDAVRRDTSRRLLANTDLDASEVAFLVGFEELNSFSRAFHNWEGVTPNRWRGGQRAEAPNARGD